MTARYAKELEALGLTYVAAKAWDVTALARPLERALNNPLAVIGSGGSFSVAAYCAGLHRVATGALARALTPLSFLDSPGADTALLCVSASGRNADIIAAFERGLEEELRPAIAFTLVADAPLVALANDYGYADPVIGPDVAEPDGFLAVNSILATCLCFARAYRYVAGKTDPFPASYSDLLAEALQERSLGDISQQIREWGGARTISVLFSPDLEAAAVDLESRFVEAALGPLHISDFRNFGHGRHNWLAKRATQTGVVSLASGRYRGLADRTLKLLPGEAPVTRIDITGEPDVIGLVGLISSLYISAGAGAAIGVDPGRPGVPDFGRKLYRLSPPRRPRSQDLPSPAIARKFAAIKRVGGRVSREAIETASAENLKVLGQATIGAIVLDYDGTVCDPRHRFDPLPETMAMALRRVIRLGLPLGIATGRGQSVAKELRRALPESMWDQVLIGFYNGSAVATLADLDAPRSRSATSATQRIADLLSAARECSDWVIEARTSQVSIAPPGRSHIDALTAYVERLVEGVGMPLRVVSSAHSVDVLLPGVSKRAVVSAITASFGVPSGAVLRIGDRGAAPGNDYELLNHPLGLSVDEVSPHLEACWRHAPPGHIGPKATLHYLNALISSPSGVRLKAVEMASA